MLRAGAATKDITPSEPAALYGYPHVERLSTGVHDPLEATAIVLAGEGAAAVLVSLDLLMLEPPVARGFRVAAAEAAGCRAEDVLLSCTHTHSGPVTSRLIAWENDPAVPPPDPAYLEMVRNRVAGAVASALQAVRPAELAWACADATGVGGNRLGEAGATDAEAGVLAVRAAGSGELLAASIIYGMHPTVLHEDSTLFSGDFPHYARLAIREHVGRQIPVGYHTGPAGDQSPRRFVTGQTFAEAERLGRMLGEAARDAIDGLGPSAWQAAPELGGALSRVQLPRNPVRRLEDAQALLESCRAEYDRLVREGAPRSEIRTAECAIFGAEGSLALAQASREGRLDARLAEGYGSAEVQVLRVGPADLVGLPGECFCAYALEIKRRAPRRCFVVSLAGGDLQGYIVTEEAAAAGGYEAANAVFAPASGKVLVEAALNLMNGNAERGELP